MNPYKTFASELLKDSIQNGDRVEISPKSMIMMNSFVELISKIGGGILAVDYGETHGFSDSVRGIANHKYIPNDMIAEFPGQVDLSAYVNFIALAQACSTSQKRNLYLT